MIIACIKISSSHCMHSWVWVMVPQVDDTPTKQNEKDDKEN